MHTQTETLEITCIDANQDFIALGTNIGVVFLYDRNKSTIERLRSDVSLTLFMPPTLQNCFGLVCVCACIRLGVKYIEKYSNTLQLLSLISDYNYITITGSAEM